MTALCKTESPCRVILTMGDPAGIGPELCLKIIKNSGLHRNIALTVIGSIRVLRRVQAELGQPFDINIREQPGDKKGATNVIDCDNVSPDVCFPPAPTSEGGRASLEYIERGVTEILAGHADVLVTCPINKKAIGAAGASYPGHTEMLGDLTDTARPVMLLLNDKLKVTFATKHVALRDVPDQLTTRDIGHTALTMADSLRSDFGIDKPSIGVCGLNPHGGDEGRFGDEEKRVIAPAVAQARDQGYHIRGPYPSDTLFEKAIGETFDGVVAMYHDQGMIPIKISGVGRVVNVTLGLPFVRTSPGHGTAYDIAGEGIADPSSTRHAIETAVKMSKFRKSNK